MGMKSTYRRLVFSSPMIPLGNRRHSPKSRGYTIVEKMNPLTLIAQFIVVYDDVVDNGILYSQVCIDARNPVHEPEILGV